MWTLRIEPRSSAQAASAFTAKPALTTYKATFKPLIILDLFKTLKIF